MRITATSSASVVIRSSRSLGRYSVSASLVDRSPNACPATFARCTSLSFAELVASPVFLAASHFARAKRVSRYAVSLPYNLG